MLEIDKCVFGPEGGSQLLSGDDFAFRFQQQTEHLEWLVLNGHADAGAKQFATAQVDLKPGKSCARTK